MPAPVAAIKSFCDNYHLIAHKLDLYAFSKNNYIKRKSSAKVHFNSWRLHSARPSENLKKHLAWWETDREDKERTNKTPHFEIVCVLNVMIIVEHMFCLLSLDMHDN